VLFSYLRIEIVSPIAAFVLGSIIGARSLRPLRSRYFVPIYAFGVRFAIYFGTLGRARVQGVGLDRLAYSYEQQQAIEEGRLEQKQTLVSRLTNFNQLTQVKRIVEEEGYLNGRTIEYLAYAFIPRFLWRDKPIIAKGQWFAARIGQGRYTSTGSVTNAVNMTVPGELYLNFGPVGAAVGCLLFGAMMAALWLPANFWSASENVLGAAFGFYLLWMALGQGPDLQIIVTLIAAYMIFLVGGVALDALTKSPHRDPAGARKRRLRA
jgi:hypothetical protein